MLTLAQRIAARRAQFSGKAHKAGKKTPKKPTKAVASTKTSKPLMGWKPPPVNSQRKCGKCGQSGHNARTCNTAVVQIPRQIRNKEKIDYDMVQKAEANSAFIGNKGHCEPLIKEILEELKELITLGELRKLTRTETISFEDFHKKRVPNKSLVKELKRALDPKELIEERVTIKRSLRSSGFRIPKQISSTELVQLARKRGLL